MKYIGIYIFLHCVTENVNSRNIIQECIWKSRELLHQFSTDIFPHFSFFFLFLNQLKLLLCFMLEGIYAYNHHISITWQQSNLNEVLLFIQNPRCSPLQHISTMKVYGKDLAIGINEIITPLKELCHVLVIYMYLP